MARGQGSRWGCLGSSWEGRECLAPSGGHQHQRHQAACWVQPHAEDAIVQRHGSVSLGWEGS